MIERRNVLYLIPSIFTLLNIFFGVLSIFYSLNNLFNNSIYCLLTAMMMDTLDGRLARITSTESAFGAQLDSLADFMSFGVATAILIHQFILSSFIPSKTLGLNWELALIFLFISAAAIRLARFNVSIKKVPKKYFIGIPSPAGTGIIISYIWMVLYLKNFNLEIQHVLELLLPALVLCVAILEISNFKYYSFKGQIQKQARHKLYIAISILLALIIVNIHIFSFITLFIYMLSAPTLYILRNFGKQSSR